MTLDTSTCLVTKEQLFLKRLFIGWLALHILICVSVLGLYNIESEHEQKHIEHVREMWEEADRFKTELVDRLSEGNVTDHIDGLINKYLSAQDLGSQNEEIKWTPIRTFSFTHEYLSTIGFGQVVPATVSGKYSLLFTSSPGISSTQANTLLYSLAMSVFLSTYSML